MNIISFFIVIILSSHLATADTSVARKKGSGNYGIHGIIYKSGIMSLVTFLAIKAKIIIILTVAFTVFIFGAKLWATFKYGNLLFDKGCPNYEHDGVILSHPPSGYGHEFVGSHPTEYEGLTPGYAYEKYGMGR